MKLLYLDCAMGAAGDMLLGALLELHPEPEDFLRRLNAALPGRVRVSAAPDQKSGVSGTHVSVTADGEEEGSGGPSQPHPHTGVEEVLGWIEALPVSDRVREHTRAVYGAIARAESIVHGCEVENIHLHELGSLDALADVLGVCMLMEELAPEKVLCSPVHVGSGLVRCAHGLLPVPAPATELLLRGVPIFSGEIRGELCTPTGAALLRHFASDFGPLPPMRVEKCGFGTGTRDFPAANGLRVLLGETEEKGGVIELACNLDDMTPEAVAFAAERLFEAGALDVYTVPIGMKKGRTGMMLCCMLRPEQRDELLRCLFRYTATLGVREYRCDRYTLRRSVRTMETAYGPVRVKTAEGWGVRREKLEYEDLARIARERGIGLEEARALCGKSDENRP